MEFLGPSVNDIDNVRALNRGYLELLRSQPGGARMTAAQAECLALSPFLLFTLREHDERLWDSLRVAPAQPDLVDDPLPPSRDVVRVQAAGLAFLWHLARRNPYAARVVSGATLRWCERLAATTLLRLLDWAATRELIAPRFDRGATVWRELLGSGAGAARMLRSSTHMRALQDLLTMQPEVEANRMRAAACAMPRVAARGGVPKV